MLIGIASKTYSPVGLSGMAASLNLLGHPVRIELTDSEAADGPRLPGLIGCVKTEAVLADTAYDSDANRAAIASAGAKPCFPPWKNRKTPIEFDRHLYQERGAAERYFAQLK